jgi:hypothetical protein
MIGACKVAEVFYHMYGMQMGDREATTASKNSNSNTVVTNKASAHWPLPFSCTQGCLVPL